MSGSLPFDLTKVPSHWNVAALGFYFAERKTVVSDSEFAPLSVTKDGVVPQLETAAKTDNNDSRKLVRVGDFVINSRSDRKGSAGLAPLDGSVSPISTVLVPRSVIHPPYANYLLRSVPFQEEFYRWGSGIVADLWSTRFSAMRRIPLPVPPNQEQIAITDFLDRETAQIDAIIEAQRDLVGLLRERRSAVVESSVLRGPDRTVKLVDSGVPWIGSVPAHWQVGCIRRFAEMHSGHTPSRQVAEYWADCDIPWFTLADVWQLRAGRQEYLGATSAQISKLGLANSAAELLPAGTVVFSRTASVGYSGIMPVAMTTSQDFWNWVCGPELLPEYLLYLFRAMNAEFGALRMGSTHQTIYQGDAAGIRITVPPLDEQREIVERIRQSLERTDAMIDAADHAINLMGERRSALISAAVTGRIDPRTGNETATPELGLEAV